MIKRSTNILILGIFILLGTNVANAQAIKTNMPLTLVGTPNIGAEFTLSQQFTVSADILWAPYMFKSTEEVFRALIGSAELRYYVKPKYYYTNDLFDGFYIGPYAMMGNFNVGLKKSGGAQSYRYDGWGVSGGVSLGYKFFISDRFRLDLNLGLGYAHLQYDKFNLGGEWADYPTARKEVKTWIGPTKFGVSMVYNIFR